LLPGLCYNDRDGTHLCPERIDPKPKPKLPKTYPPNVLECSNYGLIELCEGRNGKDMECQCANPRIYSEIIPTA